MLRVIEECCKVFGISHEQFYSKDRTRKIVECRMCAAYIIRRFYKVVWTEIGDCFKKHHSTMIHYFNFFKDVLMNETPIKEMFDDVMYALDEGKQAFKYSIEKGFYV